MISLLSDLAEIASILVQRLLAHSANGAESFESLALAAEARLFGAAWPDLDQTRLDVIIEKELSEDIKPFAEELIGKVHGGVHNACKIRV